MPSFASIAFLVKKEIGNDAEESIDDKLFAKYVIGKHSVSMKSNAWVLRYLAKIMMIPVVLLCTAHILGHMKM